MSSTKIRGGRAQINRGEGGEKASRNKKKNTGIDINQAVVLYNHNAM